jgi:hypothetical protein
MRPCVADDAAWYLGARLDSGTDALLPPPARHTTRSTFQDWFAASSTRHSNALT